MSLSLDTTTPEKHMDTAVSSSQPSLQTPKLSALVVAPKQERRLGECLSTLAFSDEIVVMLDNTTDGSEAIARKYTDRIVTGTWPLEGDRRNAGIAACSGTWTLEIDADERVPPELAAEILDTVRTSTFDYHSIPVNNYVGKRLVYYGWGASFGKGSYTGLFRKGCKYWHHQRVHPKLTMSGQRGPVLQQRLSHYVDENVSDMLSRLNRYSSSHALDLIDSGNIGTYRHNVLRILSRFYKCFVLRKGYREGAMGFVIAACAGLYPILSYVSASEILADRGLKDQAQQ